MGRHTKLTDSIQTEIERYLGFGVPVRWATEAAGISHVAHYDWIARGDVASLLAEETGTPIPDSDQKFVEYANATRKAIARGRLRYATELYALATRDDVPEAIRVRATIFFLTHADRDHWHTRDEMIASEETEEVQIEW